MEEQKQTFKVIYHRANDYKVLPVSGATVGAGPSLGGMLTIISMLS